MRPLRRLNARKRVVKPGLARAGAAWVLTANVEVISEANKRCHWSARHKRFTKQADAVTTLLLFLLPHIDKCGVTKVEMSRLYLKSPHKMDDDNLAGAFKAVRDAVAKWLGVDDGDERVRWSYGQRVSPEVGIEIRFS